MFLLAIVKVYFFHLWLLYPVEQNTDVLPFLLFCIIKCITCNKIFPFPTEYLIVIVSFSLLLFFFTLFGESNFLKPTRLISVILSVLIDNTL